MGNTDALAAVIRYEVAAASVSGFAKLIGAALEECSVSKEMAVHGESGNTRAWDRLMDGKYVNTHLHQAFTMDFSPGHEYGDSLMRDAELEAWLEDEGCEHCLRAYRLIQERRAARKEFGIAKRAIRAIGKRAIKQDTMTGGSGERTS